MKRLLSAALTAAAVLIATTLTVQAEKIGAVSTEWNLFKNHQVVIEAFDDAKVPGVTCYVSRAETGGFSGSIGIATDPSEASIACRQTGPIDTSKIASLKAGEDVFDMSASILFKTIHVSRFFDKKRNTLIYLTWSRKLINGSPKNSISAVVIRPWK